MIRRERGISMSLLGKDVNELLLKIKEGDEDSKNVLIELLFKRLTKIAWKYARNKNDAEDIVSKAFSKAFYYIYKFDSCHDGYNWLCKIIQHSAYDFNKELPDHVSLDACNARASDGDFTERIARKDQIERAMKKYRKRDRKLLELRFKYGMTYEEIATELGMKKSNAHKRLEKILKELSEKVEK